MSTSTFTLILRQGQHKKMAEYQLLSSNPVFLIFFKPKVYVHVTLSLLVLQDLLRSMPSSPLIFTFMRNVEINVGTIKVTT